MHTSFQSTLDALEQWKPGASTSLTSLNQAGSNRQYFRLLADGHSHILTYNPSNQPENKAFLAFTQQLRGKSLNVPDIVFQDPALRFYVQSDLGDHSLFDLMQQKGFNQEVFEAFRSTCTALARLQVVGGKEFDYSHCIATRSFDKQAIYSDLLYFLYYFVRALDLPYDKNMLLNDFEMLSNYLMQEEHQYFMHRDCQSRNIMLHEGRPYFIDYQGGMQGALQYDIASLLWQARAQLPYEWRQQLVDHYFDEVNRLLDGKLSKQAFMNNYDGFVLIRMLQTLGAYGFRGLFERKQHFIASIPFALKNLAWFLEHRKLPLRLPALQKVLEAIVAPEMQQRFEPVVAGPDSALQIQINSFSYRKGVPEDRFGNGGGYVFDCRGILNPGRIDLYKTLTGRDKEVKEYLMRQTEMPLFLQHVYGMVGITVEEYLKRGFEGLTISFGCTGGQHRSVFAADQLAHHLQETYKVKVCLSHIEQESKNWKNEAY